MFCESSLVDRRWSQLVSQIATIGVERVGILNPDTGLVTGKRGSFLIDDALIPKLKFIHEGKFTEQEGAPTLKLIGDLRPISVIGTGQSPRIERHPVTTRDIEKDFYRQRKVPDPKAYIRLLCHVQAIWLPLRYYLRQAKLSNIQAVELLAVETATYKSSQKRQIERLKRGLEPQQYNAAKMVGTRDGLLEKKIWDLSNPPVVKNILHAITTLSNDQIDLAYLLSLIDQSFDRYSDSDTGMRGAIRYAASHLDLVVFGTYD